MSLPNEVFLGAATDNSFIATYSRDYDSNKNKIGIYKDGKLQITYDLEDDGYINVFKIGTNEMFYICDGGLINDMDGNISYSVYVLKQLDVTTGEIKELGTLPRIIEAGEADECIIADNTIYFDYLAYAGTGHVYQGEGYYIQAKNRSK